MRIQSISDIITNSSSEVFCRICSQDDLDQIYSILKNIFPDNEYEVTPVVTLTDREDCEEWMTDSKLKELEPYSEWVEFQLPYSLDEYKSFYQFGIEGILAEEIRPNNYTIIYGE